MVLSILLAFLLWVYVGNDPNSVDTGTLRNVRVVFSGLEKLEERGLMISEGAEQTVNLQLSARGEVKRFGKNPTRSYPMPTLF